jgi:hypothetical protein
LLLGEGANSPAVRRKTPVRGGLAGRPGWTLAWLLEFIQLFGLVGFRTTESFKASQ